MLSREATARGGFSQGDSGFPLGNLEGENYLQFFATFSKDPCLMVRKGRVVDHDSSVLTAVDSAGRGLSDENSLGMPNRSEISGGIF